MVQKHQKSVSINFIEIVPLCYRTFNNKTLSSSLYPAQLCLFETVAIIQYLKEIKKGGGLKGPVPIHHSIFPCANVGFPMHQDTSDSNPLTFSKHDKSVRPTLNIWFYIHTVYRTSSLSQHEYLSYNTCSFCQ
jgi:hypothetical protein